MAIKSTKSELELLKLELEIADLKTERIEKSKLAKVELQKLQLEVKNLQENQERVQAQRHTFVLSNDIDHYTYDDLHGFLSRSNNQITIQINSPGGSVLDGLGMYDMIKKSHKHINTESLGTAASMAGILLQAGDVRSMSTNSYILIHEVASLSWGKLNEIKNEFEFLKKLQERCFTILAERSTLTIEQLTEKTRGFDWWIPADEALELGLVDVIL